MYVLDTSVFSLLYSEKPGAIELARRYNEILREVELPILPFQTMAEALFGAEDANWGERRRQQIYHAAAKCYLIVPSSATMHLYGKVITLSRSQGCELKSGDAWIAAFGVELEIPVLHHDRDFLIPKIPGLTTVTLL